MFGKKELSETVRKGRASMRGFSELVFEVFRMSYWKQAKEEIQWNV